MSERYWLKADWQDTWQEVNKQTWVGAERGAGFRNTLGRPQEPATAGFSTMNVSGSITYDGRDRNDDE